MNKLAAGKELIGISGQNLCFHCGDNCNNAVVAFDEKIFCCNGCKMVYSILHEQKLTQFYDLEEKPGGSQRF